MKICISTPIFPPEIGGPATFVPELAKRLAEKGHVVHVITYGSPAFEEKDGYSIHRISYPKLPKILALPLRMLKFALLTSKIVRKYDCQVIYTQDPSVAGIPSYFASKMTKRPLIMKYVGDWAWETAFLRGWTNQLLHDFYDHSKDNLIIKIMKVVQRIITRGCSAIIVPSKYLKFIIDRWRVGTSVVVIPNAVEIPNLDKKLCRRELSLEGKILLAVGRLEPWKGIDIILSVMPKILKEFKGAKLIIIGDGPELNGLKKIATKLGLFESVLFLGRLPHGEVLKYICASDVFILPSLYEGMSHSLLEAMSCKTPVISSNVCGNPEIVIDGKTGLLVEPKNGEQLESAILEVFNNPRESKMRVYNALQMLKTKNNWDNVTQRLLETVEAVL
jgi:glycosyltransferase involved in cell wall biosynthesis